VSVMNDHSEGVLHVKHAPVFEKLLASSRYKAAFAGRGSGKSPARCACKSPARCA
jgi:hypothetical protein